MRIKQILVGVSSGACCGIVATVPMTAAMAIIQRSLPASHRERMEPRQITDSVLNALSSNACVPESCRRIAALAAHFGYGAAAGALYPSVHNVLSRLPARGAIYGSALFVVGYAGWLPALGILPLPRDRPVGRNYMLLISHVVWGITLDWLYSRRRLPRWPSSHHCRVEIRKI